MLFQTIYLFHVQKWKYWKQSVMGEKKIEIKGENKEQSKYKAESYTWLLRFSQWDEFRKFRIFF